tara:strand:- start:7371 stop:7661 length:291 start_codon:yes stop_codon:yes gene_type:complete
MDRITFLTELEAIIDQRMASDDSNSYVQKLVSSGLDRILKKIGEEAGEVIIAAKNPSDHDLLNESADLLFHLMVLLKAKGHGIDDVIHVLADRHHA